jgi:hypothetical protein|nr:MAG: hypothetical protein [Caudoviricetes sp.]
MSLKTTIIGSFASFLLGSDTFQRIKAIVLRQADKDISGEEKREAAIEEMRLIGLGIATWMMNLAIELSVAWLKTKSGEK